jgi:hypothetical protein
LELDELGAPVDSSMHKAMILLLARVFDYELKTEDILELTNFNRSSALVVVVTFIEEANSKVVRKHLHILIEYVYIYSVFTPYFR